MHSNYFDLKQAKRDNGHEHKSHHSIIDQNEILHIFWDFSFFIRQTCFIADSHGASYNAVQLLV